MNQLPAGLSRIIGDLTTRVSGLESERAALTASVDEALTTIQALTPRRVYPDKFWLPADGADYAPATRRMIDACRALGLSPSFRADRAYLFSSTVVDPYGLRWYAEDGAIILNGSPNTPAFQLGTVGPRTYAGGVDGCLRIAGAPGVAGLPGQTGLRAFNTGQCRYATIKTVGYAPYSKLYDGVKLDDVAQATFEVEAQDCLNDGIVLNKLVDPISSRSRSDGNGGRGIVCTAVEGARFFGMGAYGNGMAWHWAKSDSGINKNNFLTNCIGDSSSGDNWLIEDLWETELHGCWAATQKNTVINPAARGFRLRGGRAKGLKFIGGRSINNNGDGISVETGDDASSPSQIVINNFDLGTFIVANAGNGKGGVGYGLHLSAGLVLSAVTLRGARFAQNASGETLNEGASDALVVVP
jgi:hypothetical protein